MIKTVGLLQRREGLDATGFREHYEQKHAPLARELLGFPGYQRNYPESDRARRGLGLDAFSEFWFRDAAEIERIGNLMQGSVGDRFREDEFRFMNPPANQSFEVSERQHGRRPAPGSAIRAIAINTLPAGIGLGGDGQGIDSESARVREREIPGVVASLYSVPVRSVKAGPAGAAVVGCIESFWLAGRETLDECNGWRDRSGVAALWVVEEVGTPIRFGPS